MVERMLALYRQRQAAHTPQKQNVLAARIEAMARQIERLVYALYGLTAEEIGVAEGRRLAAQEDNGQRSIVNGWRRGGNC